MEDRQRDEHQEQWENDIRKRREEEYHDRVTREREWLETIERKKEKAAKEKADWVEEWEAIKADWEKQNEEWLKLEYQCMLKRDVAQRELYKINPSPPSPLTQQDDNLNNDWQYSP